MKETHLLIWSRIDCVYFFDMFDDDQSIEYVNLNINEYNKINAYTHCSS